jgi:hypothetical protein
MGLRAKYAVLLQSAVRTRQKARTYHSKISEALLIKWLTALASSSKRLFPRPIGITPTLRLCGDISSHIAAGLSMTAI